MGRSVDFDGFYQPSTLRNIARDLACLTVENSSRKGRLSFPILHFARKQSWMSALS